MIRIFIVTHSSGVAQPMWLDDACAKALGATVELKAPSGFKGPCDRCTEAHQAAPGYVSPTPVCAPTSPDARRPTREECPPPRKIPPWGKPATSKQRTTGQEKAA